MAKPWEPKELQAPATPEYQLVHLDAMARERERIARLTAAYRTEVGFWDAHFSELDPVARDAVCHALEKAGDKQMASDFRGRWGKEFARRLPASEFAPHQICEPVADPTARYNAAGEIERAFFSHRDERR